MKRIWLFLLLVVSPAHAWAQEAPDCTSVAQCIAILREHEIEPAPPPGDYRSSGVRPEPISNAVKRLPEFGDAAVVALLELAKDPNFFVQTRAGYALFHFAKINPRFTQKLIAAHRAGVSWLERPIGNTGTREAFEFLWASFLDDPSYGSNSQVFLVLPRYADRLRPRLMAELERCRTSSNLRLCHGVDSLLGELEPYPAYAMSVMADIAASTAADEAVRAMATERLIREKHPQGMRVLIVQLEQAITAMGPPALGSYSVDTSGASGLPMDWDMDHLIQRIDNYEAAAVAAGPLLVPLLARRDMPDSRAAAALALGKIGYRAGAAALLAEAPTFEDDWLFAYNAVESLARLGLQEARPVLQRVAAAHWNYAVRANAQRALNMLGGGAFDRPDVKGDTAKQEVIMIGPLHADLRYAGDWMIDPQRCRAGETTQAYGQLYAQPVRWPDAGAVVELKPEMPDFARRTEELPVVAYLAPSPGETMFVAKLGAQTLIGSDAGEFGGDVFVSGAPGGLRRLIPDNANAVFVMGEKAMVVTGLSHLWSSRGQLWVVGLKEGHARVERRVRLPVEASGYALAGPDTLVIRSRYGDIGVRADGALVDVRTIAACR